MSISKVEAAVFCPVLEISIISNKFITLSNNSWVRIVNNITVAINRVVFVTICKVCAVIKRTICKEVGVVIDIIICSCSVDYIWWICCVFWIPEIAVNAVSSNLFSCNIPTNKVVTWHWNISNDIKFVEINTNLYKVARVIKSRVCVVIIWINVISKFFSSNSSSIICVIINWVVTSKVICNVISFYSVISININVSNTSKVECAFISAIKHPSLSVRFIADKWVIEFTTIRCYTIISCVRIEELICIAWNCRPWKWFIRNIITFEHVTCEVFVCNKSCSVQSNNVLWANNF